MPGIVEGLNLGCIIPDELPPAVEFSKIRTLAAENLLFDTAAAAVAKPVSIPPTVDYLSPFGKWNMLGNDTFGDCNAVAWANTRRLVTAKLGHKEVYPTLEQELVKKGGPDGVKALAFARVNPANLNEVHAALAIFGFLWLGIRIFRPQNDDEHRQKHAWTIPATKTPGAGGHAIMAGGYLPNVKIVTWGGVSELSQEYWKGWAGTTPVEQPVFECYVVVWPKHLGTRSFMVGINLQQLEAEWKLLSKEKINFPAMRHHSVYLFHSDGRGDSNIEIIKADAAQGYNSVSTRVRSPVARDLHYNGRWRVESGDVYFFQHDKTPSGRIELKRMQASAGYGQFDLQLATPFSFDDAHHGEFCIDNGDLYFIKKTDCTGPSTPIEIYWAEHGKGSQNPTKYVTGYDCHDYWSYGGADIFIRGRDLYIVRGAGTASGRLEIFTAKGSADFAPSSNAHFVTPFTPDQYQTLGAFDIGLNGDLYFLQRSGTANKKVELRITTAASGYQQSEHYTIPFAEGSSESCALFAAAS
ncbi:hypothetical protein TARUN_2850 [Trichoderma arundinaceum]|uniref:Uncharacterized protein n=1 Tax=Trichoderma arundinaceum TaxID=490622 RepID=A0A395NTV1_TRIAR|nr:hypothetical protein TARUN_2850 [Trichoderma arundinaceum]